MGSRRDQYNRWVCVGSIELHFTLVMEDEKAAAFSITKTALSESHANAINKSSSTFVVEANFSGSHRKPKNND